MQSSGLETKIQVPLKTHQTLHRAQLVDTLERGIPDHKLTLILAPAGYGKTTLLSQWAHTTRQRVAWLSLGEEDSDPNDFFRYLLAAWETVHPDIRESPLGRLLEAPQPDRDAVLSAFINVANDLPDHMVFVLDDAHLIEEPSIHEALTFLLDHLPPRLHFVLAGRVEPPLPLARYRAHHELLELRTEDLQFRLEQTREFLCTYMELKLSDEAIASLHAELEGWVAGLQLASLTLRRRPEAMAPLVISGRHRFIADYLSEDVVVHLPDEIRRFLLQTSVLDRLCGSLCNAVSATSGGQEMLELLERENLFLAPLDTSREWFRYHRLFADFLRVELHRRHPDQVRDLHRRAAHWYLAHDFPEEAFHHAVAGDDLDLGVRIFDRYMNAKLQGGEYTVVQRWLEALPAAWYAAYPAFDLARAGLLAFSGAVDACMRCVDDVEQKLAHADGDDTRRQMAKVTAIRCAIACMQNDLPQAKAYADRALRDLPEDDLGFRPLIYGALGDSYRQHGLWVEAKACYLKALGFPDAPVIRVESAHVFGALADLELRQGHLRDAAGNWSKALAAIQDRQNWGRLPLPVIGWVYLRVGELQYERNELPEAWDHLSRGLERAELGGDVRALIAGHVIAGRLKLTEGDVKVAAQYLERARSLLAEAPFPDWTSRFERCQVELWLAQDRLRFAVTWADETLTAGALEARPESEVAQLALARVLIVKGDPSARDRASALIARLLQAAEAEGRTGIQIEALALQALAHWQGGDRAGAMVPLEHALRLAEPEGYVRLFADLGFPMARLLQEARSRDVMPEYVARLLATCEADLASSASTAEALPEPLSLREQEVLKLIAAGLTNREIAETLIISPETVKKHTGSIYGKLGVRGRTEAAVKARSLDVLD
jgi:LuxR family transcriptional regulator, maltose regulon positive regulatory protein